MNIIIYCFVFSKGKFFQYQTVDHLIYDGCMVLEFYLVCFKFCPLKQNRGSATVCIYIYTRL